MAKSLELNGMIHSRFQNEAAMATAMGWSRQRLSKITTGKKTPSLTDLALMARAMKCSVQDLVPIFLPGESTTVDGGGKENAEGRV